MGDIVKQSADRTMHKRRLTAAMAVGARQGGPAIEACRFTFMPPGDPCVGLDGVRSESTRRDITGGVDLPWHGHDDITGMDAAPSASRFRLIVLIAQLCPKQPAYGASDGG